MKQSVRAATMVVVGILTMAMVAPSATAVVPGRWAHGVRCHSRADYDQGRTWGHWDDRWIVTFVLVNQRNHRSTVYGSWHLGTSRSVHSETVHRHADLASEGRQTFEVKYRGELEKDAPTIDLLGCR